MTEKQGQFTVIRCGRGPWHGGHEAYKKEFHTFCGLLIWLQLIGVEVSQGKVECRNCLRTASYDAMKLTQGMVLQDIENLHKEAKF